MGEPSPWKSRALTHMGGSGDAYTYNFEGGVILTVFGINFDYEAEVVVGGLPCQIPGTFFINSTTSAQTCYKPPYICSGGTKTGLACVDIEYSSDCPGGGTCTVRLPFGSYLRGMREYDC